MGINKIRKTIIAVPARVESSRLKKKVLEDIESFRKNNSDMWPKCNYLEELVKNNKTFN